MKYFSKIADNLQKHIYFCLVASCSILLLAACADEPYETSAQTNEKQVEVKIFLTVPAPTIAQTREASTIVDDSYYNQDGVYVMIFNGNTDDSKLLQIAKASGSSKIFYAKLNGVDGACYAYVIANSEKIIQGNQESWNAGETTLGEIKSKLEYTLNTTTAASTTALTEMVTPQPMYTEVYLKDGISATTKIGTASESVKLERSTAKISIYNETATSEGSITTEILYGANLANAPVKGHLFPNHTDLANITRANSGVKGVFNDPIATPATGGNSCYLYTFESVIKEGQSTSIIVKASWMGQGAYYYHIRLSNEADDYSLMRNFNYIVHIKSILKQGYDTAEEALRNPAGNIEYTLSVTDAYSRDIVSNGEYYLGVENSEFYAFTDPSGSKEALKDQLVSIIMHNAKSVSGKFTIVEGSGLYISGSDNFINNGGGEQKVELKIYTDEGFTDGAIKVELGDLSRTIKIHKRTMPNKFGTILTDFKDKGYVSGSVTNKEDGEWLRLTTLRPNGNDPKPDDLDDKDLSASVENATGNIYLRVKANIGDDKSPDYREGTVDFFRGDEGGNARVLIKQPVHDIYTDIIGQAKIAPYTYVGTFHRHDQVGERIIRVDTKISGGSVARWRAFIVYGDFVRLSIEKSKDDRIGLTNFYGEGDTTDKFGYDVEAYPVNNGKTDTDEQLQSYIYFRVGLTSQITAGAVRYGLIGLQVNGDVGTEKITRYIFVRQGEDADYLMRPQDMVTMNPDKGENTPLSEPYSRDKAVKISPFNLTDPSKNPGLRSDLSKTKGRLADYPSQAGYLYQTLSNQGWVAEKGVITSTPEGWNSTHFQVANTPWNADSFERCPDGYERVKGGADYYNSSKPAESYSSAVVKDSPIRQSLWLYPKNRGISETQNFIIGYIADGFYDRQEMHSKCDSYQSINGLDKQPIAVNHKDKIAYIGVLAFNPHNAASLFLPMAGYYMGDMGPFPQIYEVGLNGSFYTKTPIYTGGTNNYYTVDWGFMYGSSDGDSHQFMFRADNYTSHSQPQANNIRCVRTQ